MLDAALLAAYIAACLLIAIGAGLIFLPAGLITGGVLGAGTVIRVARAPAPSPEAAE